MDKENIELVDLNKFNSSIDTFASYKNTLMDVYDGKVAETYSTGFSNVDNLFKLQTKRLMIITGTSGRGKTFFAHNILFNTYKQYGWKHLICSLEGEPEDMYEDFIQMEKEKPVRQYSTDSFVKKDRMTREEYQCGTDDGLSKHFFRFKTTKQWDTDKIIEHARFAVGKYGIKTIVIDPYNKLSEKKSSREDRDIGEMLNKLLVFAKEADLLVIFIAHPTTASSREKNYIPTVYDISGGGTWMNMCDYGISIHRYLNESGNKRSQTKVVVHKVKSRAIGDPSGGQAYLNYCFDTFKLRELKANEQKHDNDTEVSSFNGI